MLRSARTVGGECRRDGSSVWWSWNGAQRLVARLTSPRKVLACVGGGLTLLTVARVVVLIVEAYSAVWSERSADRELMRVCESGTVSMSADFRALCLKKRAEQASPLLLKALLRAFATAFADFCESMSSPTKVVLLLLFCLTGVAAPVVKALATLVVDNLKRRHRRGRRAKAHDSDSESDGDDAGRGHRRVVVVGPDDLHGPIRSRWPVAPLTMTLRRSVRRVQRMGRAEAPPYELGAFEEDTEPATLASGW